MKLPNFLKQDGYTIKYDVNDGSELVYYIPEDFFNSNTKNPIAQIEGEYVSFLGLCLWGIVDKNGKVGQLKLLKIPTIFNCKPYTIDTIKEEKLAVSNSYEDYRILRFRYGDEVISNIRTEKNVDYAELLFKVIVFTAKVPTLISYEDVWKLFLENAEMTGINYGLNIQLYCMLTSIICRNPNDVSQPFRYTSMKDMHDYKPISIRSVPKYISPFTAITSENFDEGVRSSILLSKMPEEDIPYSPLEKVLMQ